MYLLTATCNMPSNCQLHHQLQPAELQLSSYTDFLCINNLYNNSLLSKVIISLETSSCLTDICRQHGPLHGGARFRRKLQPGYQLACRIQCHPIIGTVDKGGTDFVQKVDC